MVGVSAFRTVTDMERLCRSVFLRVSAPPREPLFFLCALYGSARNFIPRSAINAETRWMIERRKAGPGSSPG